jgi:hypothetical protein
VGVLGSARGFDHAARVRKKVVVAMGENFMVIDSRARRMIDPVKYVSSPRETGGRRKSGR